MECFTLDLQLTQTPGPSIARLLQTGVPSALNDDEHGPLRMLPEGLVSRGTHGAVFLLPIRARIPSCLALASLLIHRLHFSALTEISFIVMPRGIKNQDTETDMKN